MSARPVCEVCDAPAPITRTHAFRGTLDLCYTHEDVCWPHRADPCEVCEVNAHHPADCGFCAAGEPMIHNYEPVTS